MDFDEMLVRLEEKFSTSDDFRFQMKLATERIKALDASPSTKMMLMKKVEDTYQLHSQNHTALNSIMQVLSDNQQKLESAISSTPEAPSKIPRDYRENDPYRIGWDIDLD